MSEEQRIAGFDKSSETAISVSELALQKARELLEEGKHREASYASATARNASTVAGIHTDKSMILQGRPTQIHGTRDARELLEEIRRELGTPIDSTATELPAGELTEG
jgi:hypothetical protein